LSEENKNKKGKLLINDKDIVAPGDVLARGFEYLPSYGTYRKGEEIISKIVGMVKVKNSHMIRVIPLSGAYIPQEGDGVIGRIEEVNISSWVVDINSPYAAFLGIADAVDEFVDLSKTDITEYFDVEDVIYAKVSNVTKRKDIKLTMKERMCRKLEGGNIVRITPAKVPRLIGKGGSMIELIKKKTGTHIIVGQNGLVWLKGGDPALAARAVEMVDKYSHVDGLTDKINEMLEKFGGENEEGSA